MVTNTKFGLFYVVYVMLLLWCGLINSWCCVSLGTRLQKTIFTEITDLWDCTDNITDQRFDANSSWSNTGMSIVTNTDHFCVTFYIMTVLLIERLIIFSIFSSVYHVSFHIKFCIILSLKLFFSSINLLDLTRCFCIWLLEWDFKKRKKWWYKSIASDHTA